MRGAGRRGKEDTCNTCSDKVILKTPSFKKKSAPGGRSRLGKWAGRGPGGRGAGSRREGRGAGPNGRPGPRAARPPRKGRRRRGRPAPADRPIGAPPPPRPGPDPAAPRAAPTAHKAGGHLPGGLLLRVPVPGPPSRRRSRNGPRSRRRRRPRAPRPDPGALGRAAAGAPRGPRARGHGRVRPGGLGGRGAGRPRAAVRGAGRRDDRGGAVPHPPAGPQGGCWVRGAGVAGSGGGARGCPHRPVLERGERGAGCLLRPGLLRLSPGRTGRPWVPAPTPLPGEAHAPSSPRGSLAQRISRSCVQGHAGAGAGPGLSRRGPRSPQPGAPPLAQSCPLHRAQDRPGGLLERVWSRQGGCGVPLSSQGRSAGSPPPAPAPAPRGKPEAHLCPPSSGPELRGGGHCLSLAG